jgi:hypothetical protein
MHGLQQGREYISVVTVHEANNNFRFTLRQDGWNGEISFYGIQSLLLLLSEFYEGNLKIHNYLFYIWEFHNTCHNGVQVEALLKLYANEKYILVVNQQLDDLKFYVSFKVCLISLMRINWKTHSLFDLDYNIRYTNLP